MIATSFAYVLPSTGERISRNERQYGQEYIYTCEPAMCGPIPCPASRTVCGWRRAPTFIPVYPSQNGGYNSRPVQGQGSYQGQPARGQPARRQPAQTYGQPYGQSYGYLKLRYRRK